MTEDASPIITCGGCRYAGTADSFEPAMSLYADLRCPKCGSTNNPHNAAYAARINASIRESQDKDKNEFARLVYDTYHAAPNRRTMAQYLDSGQLPNPTPQTWDTLGERYLGHPATDEQRATIQKRKDEYAEHCQFMLGVTQKLGIPIKGLIEKSEVAVPATTVQQVVAFLQGIPDAGARQIEALLQDTALAT